MCHMFLSLLLCFLELLPAVRSGAYRASRRQIGLISSFFVDDFELCVDHVAIAAASAGALFCTGTRFVLRAGGPAAAEPCAGRGLLVKLGADFLELVLQVVVGPLHRLGVVAIDRFAHRGDGVFDLLLLVAGNLVARDP